MRCLNYKAVKHNRKQPCGNYFKRLKDISTITRSHNNRGSNYTLKYISCYQAMRITFIFFLPLEPLILIWCYIIITVILLLFVWIKVEHGVYVCICQHAPSNPHRIYLFLFPICLLNWPLLGLLLYYLQLSCRDYLTPLSSICSISPGLSGCNTYYSWCSDSTDWEAADGSSMSLFCKQTSPPSPTTSPPSPMSCVTDSSSALCVSYEYPLSNITSDLNSLCTSMAYMPGCTIRAACQVRRVVYVVLLLSSPTAKVESFLHVQKESIWLLPLGPSGTMVRVTNVKLVKSCSILNSVSP